MLLQLSSRCPHTASTSSPCCPYTAAPHSHAALTQPTRQPHATWAGARGIRFCCTLRMYETHWHVRIAHDPCATCKICDNIQIPLSHCWTPPQCCCNTSSANLLHIQNCYITCYIAFVTTTDCSSFLYNLLHNRKTSYNLLCNIYPI